MSGWTHVWDGRVILCHWTATSAIWIPLKRICSFKQVQLLKKHTVCSHHTDVIYLVGERRSDLEI